MNKSLYFIAILFCVKIVNAQRSQHSFLDQQFWVGVQIGTNITKANPIERYTIFSPTDAKSTKDYEKNYIDFKNFGQETALYFSYDYKGFGCTFAPSYARYSYAYGNDYAWQDTASANFKLEQSLLTTQNLDYFRLPLSFKYYAKKLAFRPIVELGFYYSVLLSANRSSALKTTDYASGSQNAIEETPNFIGNKNLFLKSNLGWFTGFGVSHSFGNLNATLMVNYWRNTHVISDRKNRYEDPFLGNGSDIQDDIQLRNWSSSICLAMPLRYVFSRYAKSR